MRYWPKKGRAGRTPRRDAALEDVCPPVASRKKTSVDNQKRLWILTFLPREL